MYNIIKISDRPSKKDKIIERHWVDVACHAIYDVSKPTHWNLNLLLLRPSTDMKAEYSDGPVCLSLWVCVSVHDHIQKRPQDFG